MESTRIVDKVVGLVPYNTPAPCTIGLSKRFDLGRRRALLADREAAARLGGFA